MKLITDEILAHHLEATRIWNTKGWAAQPMCNDRLHRWLVAAIPVGADDRLRPVVAMDIRHESQARAIGDLPDVLAELQQLRTVARRAIACIKQPADHNIADLADIVGTAGRLGL